MRLRIGFLYKQGHARRKAAIGMALLLTAIAGGGKAYAQSGSPAATSTTLTVNSQTASVTSAQFSLVTLTATVVSGSTPVTQGLVQFCDETAIYCTDLHEAGAAQLTSAGTATIQIYPRVGNHTYKAWFVGTPNASMPYATSTSAPVKVAVKGVTTTGASQDPAPGIVMDILVSSHGSAIVPTGEVDLLNSSGDFKGSVKPLVSSHTSGMGRAGQVDVLNSSAPGSGSGTIRLAAADSPMPYFAFSSLPPLTSGISTPVALATADFDGDGRQDVAVINAGSSKVAIFLNQGSLTQAPIQPATGSNPSAIVAGDFNGDGAIDLAVANSGSNNVTILLGNGDGSFTTVGASPATGTAPDSIAVGDFNNDGIEDLAVANGTGNTVTILLGVGNGTFVAQPASPVTGNDPSGIVSGDFNGDGFIDLAVANRGSDSVTVLLGAGNGTFTAAASPATGTTPTAIAAGDFNRDGKLDLAVTNSASDTVTVLLGNGLGAFTATATSPATGLSPSSIVLADFNADGKLDIAAVNSGSNSVTILLGNSTGGFAALATDPQTGQTPAGAAVLDIDGDSIPDLVIANRQGNSVTPIETTLTATMTSQVSVSYVSVFEGGGPFTVAYDGDTNYDGSESGPFSPYPNPALPPTLTPPPGVYPAPVTVTIADTSPGETLYITTDGSTPTYNNGNTYGPGPVQILVNSTETVTADADLGDQYWTIPSYAGGTYVISPPTTAPVFTPAPGAYLVGQQVSLADSMKGAVIYYTTNGATPTPASTVYKTPITLSRAVTVKAIALAPNHTLSPVVTAAYTIGEPSAAPVFTPAAGAYRLPQSITLTAAAGAQIYYALHSATATVNSTKYTGPFALTETGTIAAVAVAPGLSVSPVATAKYTVVVPPPAATPVLSAKSGVYGAGFLLTLTDASPGASIYYTTNESTPTASSTKYTGPITVSATETVIAMAEGVDYTPSALASAAYMVVGSPAVEAMPATGISATAATLNAIADSMDVAATYSFQYGTSSAALTSTTAQTTLAATATQARISAKLAGLKSKTTFYYRAVVTTVGGSSTSAIESFTTD